MKEKIVKIELNSYQGHGFDKRKHEFRIPELKALLRSTFRELFYFENMDDFNFKQGVLFGNTENKSPVSIIPITIRPNVNKIAICFRGKNEFIDFYMDLLVLASITGAMGRGARKAFKKPVKKSVKKPLGVVNGRIKCIVDVYEEVNYLNKFKSVYAKYAMENSEIGSKFKDVILKTLKMKKVHFDDRNKFYIREDNRIDDLNDLSRLFVVKKNEKSKAIEEIIKSVIKKNEKTKPRCPLQIITYTLPNDELLVKVLNLDNMLENSQSVYTEIDKLIQIEVTD